MEERNEEKPWYHDEKDKFYEDSVNSVKEAVVRKKRAFDDAVAGLKVDDEELRAAIADDSLKVLIAELHFMGKKPLEELARTLKVSVKRLRKARDEMLADVEQSAIDAYKSSLGQSGNA